MMEMGSMIRTYTELRRLQTFEERYRYLALRGFVGRPTFGADRYINQAFYTSHQWAQVRQHVILRDRACDLGMPEREIHAKLTIHHMNPMTVAEIAQADESILDPEFLITTTHGTHNAIHYGDERLLPQFLVERSPGDTTPWKRRERS